MAEDEEPPVAAKLSLLLSNVADFFDFFFSLLVSVDASFFLFLMPPSNSSIAGSKGSWREIKWLSFTGKKTTEKESECSPPQTSSQRF